MTEWQIRELMCDIGRRVWRRGYVAANDGNFSCRLDETRVLATPTLMSKGYLEPSDLVVVDLEGNQLAGQRKMTSEIKMHLHCYRHRPDVTACVHAHPPHATAFAIVQDPVPKCVMPEAEVNLGEIPIVPYATPGTQAFADALDAHIQDFNVFLLASHGVLALAGDLLEAYHRLETVDHYCNIIINVRQLGDPTRLTPEAMAELFELKRRMGIHDRRIAPGGDASCDAPSPTPKSESATSEAEIDSLVQAVIETIRKR